MSTGTVMTILARYLLDSGFSKRFDEDRVTELQQYALDEHTRDEFLRLDLRRVRSFRGLITKVQQNYLWEFFPGTRLLLRYAGIELRVFDSYSEFHQNFRTRTDAPRSERIRRFIDFLGDFLQSSDAPAYPVLRDVLKHERIQWEMQDRWATVGAPAGGFSSIDLRSLRAVELGSLAPAFRGIFILAGYRHDPVEILATLSDKGYAAIRAEPSQRTLAYWSCGPAERVRMFQPDPATLGLLAQVNGRRSVRSILRSAASHERVSQSLPFWEAAQQKGLVTFQGLEVKS